MELASVEALTTPAGFCQFEHRHRHKHSSDLANLEHLPRCEHLPETNVEITTKPAAMTPEEREHERQRRLKQRWIGDRKPPTQEELEQAYKNSRLSLPAGVRIPLATVASFVVGWSLGTAQGSKMAGLRFRAEHAHKLPDTTTGWYLYHKSKNYHVATGGLVEGVKMGLRVSFWTTAMLGIEHMFDTYRGTSDVLNTLTSCVAVAGGFSLWNRFSLPMAARTTKTAVVVGLIYGGVQDALGAARGRPIGYIDSIKRQLVSDSPEYPEKSGEPAA